MIINTQLEDALRKLISKDIDEDYAGGLMGEDLEEEVKQQLEKVAKWLYKKHKEEQNVRNQFNKTI